MPEPHDDLTLRLRAAAQRAEHMAPVPSMERERARSAAWRTVALSVAALLIVGAPITVAMLHARPASAPAHKHPMAPPPPAHTPDPFARLAPNYPPPPAPSTSPLCYIGETRQQPRPALGAVFVYDDALQADVMFGGFFSSTQASRETWLWHCGAWTQVHPAHSPAGFRNYGEGALAVAAAYDPVHRLLVLYDADSGTWTFDGTDWRRAATTFYPPLHSPVMAWDSTRQDTLLVADPLSTAGASAMLTYVWMGDRWQQQRTQQAAPDLREGPVLMDDPNRHVVLLVGGVMASRGDIGGGTWTWDGVAWTHLPGPAPVEGTVGTYDRSQGVGVVVATDGTWTWTGLHWEKAHPQTEPPLATYRAATYDAAVRVVMLFGGKVDTASGGSQISTDIWTGAPPDANWSVMRGTTRAYE